MLVLDVKNRTKRIFGDTSGTFLEDVDLLAWINEALLEIHRNNRITKLFFSPIILANVNSYSLPANYLAIDKVFLGESELSFASTPESNMELVNGSTLDVPIGYYSIIQSSIFTNIILPFGSIKNGVFCRILYTAGPATVILDTDDLLNSTPLPYHELIIRYCLARASEMAEEFSASDRFQAMFDLGIIEMRGEIKAPVETSYGSVSLWGDDY